MPSFHGALFVAGMIVAVGAAPAVAAGKGPIDRGEPMSLEVRTGGVDFRDPQAVEAFYGKLQRSALFVCGYSLEKDREAQAKDRACAEAALKSAVGAVNRPTLTAMHQQSGAPMLARGW